MRRGVPLLAVLAVAVFGCVGQPQAAPPPPDKVFVLVGDEQLLGRAPLTAESANPKLWALIDGAWQPAIDPLGYRPSADDGVGPGRAFGEAALADLGDPSVGLIVCGAAHSSMATWKDRKSVYKKCEQQARPWQGRIVGFVFVEGTWDASKATIGSSWPKAFHETLAAFRSDLGLDVPAVVAEVGPITGHKFRYADRVRAAQQQAALEPQTTVVATDDLAVDPDNGVDFTAGAYETLGVRLENAWWQLVDPSSVVSNDPPDQLFILAGQSNMLGRGFPLSQGTPSNSDLWNWRGGFWRIASDSLGSPTDPDNGIGPGMTFGTELLAADGGTIGLVMCAVGSTGMSDWQPGQGPFENCVGDAASAGGAVTGLLFLQGERDATQKGLASKWAAKFKTMLAGFRSVFGDIPAVVAKIPDITAPGHKYTQLVQEQQDVAAADPENTDVRFFPTSDQPLADGSHFTVAAYKVIGERFADNWLDLTGP